MCRVSSKTDIIYIYMGVVFIPLRLFPFRSSCASPLHALARPAFQSLLRFWKGFFFNEHGCIKKIDLESVLQEQNVKSEMVSGKVFQSGPILEPNHAIYTSLLQFQSNDAAPEEA